jgi:4-diphosphocytidyl-2-C-methyl-D-erythritol kinase
LLAPAALAQVAAEVGSDCALFLPGGPVVMRGRGERVEPLPAAAAGKLRGRPVLIFKPGFAIATPWAYARFAAQAKGIYSPVAEAETRLAALVQAVAAGGNAEELLANDLERAAFAKFVALPVLLDQLRRQFGLAPRMSGSGSACFALIPAGAPVAAIEATVRAAWGASAFVVETQLA